MVVVGEVVMCGRAMARTRTTRSDVGVVVVLVVMLVAMDETR